MKLKLKKNLNQGGCSLEVTPVEWRLAVDPADRFRRLWELSSGSELLLLQQHHHSVLVSAGRRIHLMLGLVTRVSGIWVGLGLGLKLVVVVLSSETVVGLGLGLPADEARVGLDVVVVVVVVVPGSGPVV